MSHLIIQREDPLGEGATRLIAELTAELAQRYQDNNDDGSGSFHPSHAQQPRSGFVVARLDNTPVGCGALRPIDDATVEFKRMYVVPAARGQGIARAVLLKLERLAAEFGYHLIRLETGTRQPEAIRLYEKAGYQHIPPYGENIGNPLSVCFEKKVPPSSQRRSS